MIRKGSVGNIALPIPPQFNLSVQLRVLDSHSVSLAGGLLCKLQIYTLYLFYFTYISLCLMVWFVSTRDKSWYMYISLLYIVLLQLQTALWNLMFTYHVCPMLVSKLLAFFKNFEINTAFNSELSLHFFTS